MDLPFRSRGIRKRPAEMDYGAILRERVPVLQVELVDLDEGGFVGYRKLAGESLAHGARSAGLGARLGEFLAALHAFPVDRARRLTGGDWEAEKRATVERFRTVVLPLLDGSERPRGEALLGAALAHPFEPALVHGDLGPEHLLHRGEELTGVIDWSDARVADPAIDFAWLLYGTSPPFTEQLLRSYGRTDETLRRRALVFHRLGPWHEALYGLDENRPELVASGLDGVRDDDTVEWALLDPLDRGRREDPVRRACVDLRRPALLQELGTGDERPGRVDHVVGHHRALAGDVADHVRDVGDVVRRPVLLQHGEVASDHLRELAGQARAARVGGDGDELLREPEVTEVLRQHRQRGHVVDRHLEESLDLARVEIHRQHAIGAGRLDHLRHELRRDRLARARLLVLAGVRVERQHC